MGVAFVAGYVFRMTALYRAWEEPLAREPVGVYQHGEGRPLLGRKLKGKSQRELRAFGLTVEEPGSSDQQTPETRPLGGTR